MAHISNVTLRRVGRVSSSTEFAEIAVTVNWTAREMNENFWYLLRTYLIERDDSLDSWIAKVDGGITRHANGDADDVVGGIASQWVRPNGASVRTYTFRRNWDFGDREDGNEEYRGLATIVPETRGDIRVSSNEISANLG